MSRRPLEDLTGQRFGKWTVLVRAENRPNNSNIWWLCECDCGTKRDVPSSRLKCKRKKEGSLSCGCGRIPPPGKVGQKRYVNQYKANASSRGYEWALTNEQAIAVAVQNCHYCGASPSNRMFAYAVKDPDVLQNGVFVNNGIDRVDNSKGYIIGNVVASCTKCNYSKGAKSVDEWLSWINEIAKRHPKSSE